MKLRTRIQNLEERTLAALCDTFVPRVAGMPAASELGVPEALLQVVARLPSALERSAFRALVLAFAAPGPALAAGKGPHRFAQLDQADREAVLLSWADSKLLARRAGFQALRRGAAILSYVVPGPDGRNPLWDRLGYPGPLGVPEYPPAPELQVDHIEAAGATKIFSSHSTWVAYEPGRGGGPEGFLEQADAAGWTTGRCILWSAHIMGSARMGASPEKGAFNPEGRSWEVDRLWLCDGAALPSAPGVNPMVSIEAVAHMNARAALAVLG